MRRFFLGNLVAVGLLTVRLLMLALAMFLRYLAGAPDEPAAAAA